MEKLINLLNEYEKENGRSFQVKEIGMKYRNNDLMVISKRYGFIKWLVENDKIDLDKVKEIGIKHNGKMDVDGLYRYSIYERVLMLLSISSSPIEDLLLYLK